MIKEESVQKRLQKAHSPRVQLVYDVEVSDTIGTKELLSVVGVATNPSG